MHDTIILWLFIDVLKVNNSHHNITRCLRMCVYRLRMCVCVCVRVSVYD